MNLKHKSGINKTGKFRVTRFRFHDMSENFNTGKEIYHYNEKLNFEKLNFNLFF